MKGLYSQSLTPSITKAELADYLKICFEDELCETIFFYDETLELNFSFQNKAVYSFLNNTDLKPRLDQFHVQLAVKRTKNLSEQVHVSQGLCLICALEVF